MLRPNVVLPQPDSPTRPLEAHVVDGFHVAVDAAEHALAQGIPRLQVLHLEQGLAAVELLEVCPTFFVGDLQVVQDLLLAALPLAVEELLDDGQALEAHVDGRTAGEEALCVGMFWVVEDVVHRAALQYLAVVHHGDVVGDLGHHAEVVGDEDHAHARLGCTVTSRAVVGSSAMSSWGWQAMAMAIITRCFCPPESSWG